MLVEQFHAAAAAARNTAAIDETARLLWRGHAAAARDLRTVPPTGHYLRSRLIRIMPAYLVAVVVILTLLQFMPALVLGPVADHLQLVAQGAIR